MSKDTPPPIPNPPVHPGALPDPSRRQPGFRVPNAAAEKLLKDVQALTDKIEQLRQVKKHTYSSGQTLAKLLRQRHEKQEELRAMFRVAD